MNIHSLTKNIFACFIFLIFAGLTSAYAITVTSTSDDGSGGLTLREAIEMANLDAGPDIINFNIPLSNTIVLNSEIEITDDLTINGPGANLLTISGDYSNRIFRIESKEEINVSISGLRFAYGSNENGGAIFNAENLDIDSCIFEDNFALGGGAIFNGGEFAEPCVLNITNTQFLYNNAEGNGGAIFNTGTIGLIDNCEFKGNEAGDGVDDWLKTAKDSQVQNGLLSSGNGGAIFNTFSNLAHDQNAFVNGNSGGVIEHISNTLFEDNRAVGGDGFNPCAVSDTANIGIGSSGFGGAIFNGAAIDVIETSAFIGNEAVNSNFEETCQTANGQTSYTIEGVSQGGAIFSEYTLNLIRNCTFYDNTANTGGALYFSGPHHSHEMNIIGDGDAMQTPTRIDFCTITENTGTGLINYDPKVNGQNALTTPNDEVGGIATGNGATIVQLSNSIVANQNQGFDCDEEGIQSLGNNIDSDGTCTGGPGDMTTMNPGLDPDGPQDNGGPTPTIALCTGVNSPSGCTVTSPAINNAGECNIDNDQRFFIRSDPFGNLCDIGAFEANSIPVGQRFTAPTLSQYGMIAVGILTIISVFLFRRKNAEQAN